MRKPPANQQLRRAQLVLALAVLVPTVLMSGVGILLLVLSGGVVTVVLGVLVLTFTTSGITGYILGSIFVGRGASMVQVQNDFVSSVSHELRTPITSIRLLIESLGNDRLERDDKNQVLSLLARETNRLEKLVDRVLELSQLQSSYVFHRHHVDVAALVEESVAAFDAITLTNPTPVTVSVEPGLVVTGDRPTLVRALVNLMTNAWKYTGEVKQISVVARAAGRRIEILVRDNGLGIPRNEKAILFEQFRRGRDALASGEPGVGLGLAFVRAIMQGHRGKIDVQSRPGETTFRLRFKRRGEVRAVAALAQERVAP